MWVWLDRLGVVLFDATASATLFLSAIMLAILMCRQPGRRIQIARSAVLASLVLIPLVAFHPLRRLDVIDVIVRSDRFPSSLLFNPDQSEHALPTSGRGEVSVSRRRTDGSWPTKIAAAETWLSRSLTLCGVVGASIGLAWLVLGYVGVIWLIGQSREPSARTQLVYEELQRHAATTPGRRRRRAVVRVSSRLERPVVVGVLRPTILIPRSMEEWQGAQEHLRLTLLHEIAHAEQADPWFGMVASLAQTLWFFVPQIWWLRSQLLIDQEFMADHLAALNYGTSSSYASSLLVLAEHRTARLTTDTPPGEYQAYAAGGQENAGGSPLFQRLLMLLHCPYRIEGLTPRPWSWAVGSVVISTAIVASCLYLRWPDLASVNARLEESGPRLPRSFKVANLVSEPMVLSHGGRSVAYLMPLVLPSAFELTVDVAATVRELAHIRIVGHSLASASSLSPGPEGGRDPSEDRQSWHKVRLERIDDRLSVRVDGQSIPVDPVGQKTSEWLTIEPGSEREVGFRNLVVTW